MAAKRPKGSAMVPFVKLTYDVVGLLRKAFEKRLDSAVVRVELAFRPASKRSKVWGL